MQIKEMEQEINELNQTCEIANDNSNGQVVVSGKKNAIDSLNLKLKNKKKRGIILPVSAPFHCSLMKSAAEKMKDKIKPINFTDPVINVISNVTAEPEKNSEKIKNLLVEQIYTKVRWSESILYMEKKRINEFDEMRTGKVL